MGIADDNTDIPLAAYVLVSFFDRCGFVRRRLPDRLREEGYRRYKKGDEIRFDVSSADELMRLRRALESCGFRAGSSYVHSPSRVRQPVYGRKQVARFLELVEAVHREPATQ